jgi:prepilin-type processing-associated H-X9-DG protein
MHRHLRSGFTLFGLLAVLAVIGILMALLLPAIQKVREAANRMKDGNNLKQIGIALHMYANDYNRFPTGYGGAPEAQGNNIKADTGAWCFMILPYIEQDALYRAIPQGQDAAVPTYYSPLRRAPGLYGNKSRMDYAGVAGSADDPEKPDKDDGIFSKERITFAQILDGTSNTVMVAMKGMRSTEYLTGNGAGDKGSCWTGGTTVTLRTCHGDKRPPLRDVPHEDHERGFGGPSASGVNFLFGDGSVRLVPYRIKGDVFLAICTRNGGEVVNLDF